MTVNPRRFAGFALLAILMSTATAASLADSPPAAAPAPGWPQAHSDVAADPAVRFGQLANGMRYAIQRNSTPPAQVSLRLRIGSGSLEEDDSQQGLAHFLEHMAFHGSASVPDGEVWKRLERLGLKMGADTNAFTAQTMTVYKFDLAHNDAASLDTGLTMLRETADALTLDPKAFDGERGVVLSEMRLNDNPSRHMMEDLQRFLLPGQLASERNPIGKQDVLKNAPVTLVRRYYETWYRPERATLIVTGDIDVDAIEAQIRTRFANWKARTAAPAEPVLGTVRKRGPTAHVYVEAGAPSLTTLSWTQPYDATPDSVAREQRDLNRQVALAILNRRMQEAAASASRQFTQGQAVYQAQAQSAMVTTLYVLNDPGAWRPALLAADALRRQLLDGGVQEAEVEREIAALRNQFQSEAAAAATRHTPRLADALLATLDGDDVYTSPEQDLALAGTLLGAVSVASVNEGLHSLFAGSGPLAFVSSPVAVDGGDAAALHALEEAEGAKLTVVKAVAAVQWPYTSFGTPGTVAERRRIEDLDVTEVRYANGVRLNVKPTRFSADQVLVNVNVAGGRLAMAPDRPSIGWASGALVAGGTGKLDYSTLERVLAGKNFGASFQIGDSAYTFAGQTTTSDLVTQLQVLAAYVTDPGWRDEAFEQQRSEMAAQLNEISAVPMMRFQTSLGGLLHDHDLRWAYPDAAQVAAAKPQDLQGLIAPALSHAPIEVTIVGDVTVEQAIGLVAATFGALPARADAPRPSAQTHFPAATPVPVVLRHAGAPDQGVAAAAWPTTDAFTGLAQSAARLLLADVMQQRLFDAVRVKAGTSYTTQATSQASTTFTGFGILLAFADIPPGKASGFYDALATIVADLKAHGPTADELERARNPAVAKATQSRQTNGYWLGIVSQLQSEPRYAELARRLLPGLQAATIADVQRAAQDYLVDARQWRLLVEPAGAK